jgi:hypothetical protein
MKGAEADMRRNLGERERLRCALLDQRAGPPHFSQPGGHGGPGPRAAAAALTVAGELRGIGPGEKGDRFTARPPAGAARAAIHPRRTDRVDERAVRPRIAREHRRPARLVGSRTGFHRQLHTLTIPWAVRGSYPWLALDILYPLFVVRYSLIVEVAEATEARVKE